MVNKEKIKKDVINDVGFTLEERRFLKFVDRYRTSNADKFVHIVDTFRLAKKFLGITKDK